MRIRYIYRGEEKIFNSPKASIIVGRPKANDPVDLDLTPDMTVSRPHAYISFERGRYWIEDRKSSRGTKVDDEEIRGCGKIPLTAVSCIRMGDTTLYVEPVNVVDDATLSPILPPVEPPALSVVAGEAPVAPVSIAPLSDGMEVPFESPESRASRQQRLLYELLLQFGGDAPFDRLLQIAVERLVAALPAAERGALLLKEPATGEWLLKAHCPPGEPAVSTTLAEHAMNCGGGFIWQRGKDLEISVPEIASGIYAPLAWRGETFGVVCVDNCNTSREFTNADLELVVAAAQHIALAVANHRLRDDLRRKAELVERLLTNFSPAIRKKLLDKAQHGRLRLGGEKSEVTILSSDIRGFTALSAGMDADDLVDMLNTYFSALVGAIFRHDGTIDKFVGDAILAVFGSPEPDLRQHANAVRAAIAMKHAIEEINDSRRDKGLVVCEMGIGIHCGEVLHGFIGSEERMEFTVIGDAVNRASRYCDGAGPGQVLISPELYQRVFKLVTAKQITIATKHEGNLAAYTVERIKVGAQSTLATLPPIHVGVKP
jgi:adenylate cyclase